MSPSPLRGPCRATAFVMDTAGDGGASVAEVVIGLADDGVSVPRGDMVVVRLPEASTAGYQWRITLIDPPRLEVVSSTLQPGGAEPGAAGVREFRLRANAVGRALVEFELARAWEAVPQQRHTLGVDIA